MRLFYLFPVLLMLGGCSAVGPLASSTGVKTTTTYDADGHVVSQIQEEKPLLDSQTAYQETMQKISEDHAKALESVSTGLQKSLTAIAKDKNVSSDARALMLYRGMESFESLGKYANIDPTTLAAVQRSMSGYDLTYGLGKAAISGGMWSYLGHAAAGVLKGFSDAAGDRTDVNVGGDGNTVSLDKRNIKTEIHANTTGDNSSPNVETSPSTGCEKGNCDKSGEALEPGIFNLDSCLKNPPAGYINGRAQWTPTCSCSSHDAGHC